MRRPKIIGGLWAALAVANLCLSAHLFMTLNSGIRKMPAVFSPEARSAMGDELGRIVQGFFKGGIDALTLSLIMSLSIALLSAGIAIVSFKK